VTDEFTPADRQKYVFEAVLSVLKGDFQFDDKDQARRFFLTLRQKFITWNSTVFQSADFKRVEKEWQDMLTKMNKAGVHAKSL